MGPAAHNRSLRLCGAHLVRAGRPRLASLTPLLLVVLIWLGAICFGMERLLRYSYAPGPKVASARSWPSNSSLKPAIGQATLVLAAHPYCPCTRATLGELAIILARCQGRLRAEVLFYRPAQEKTSWSHSDLWRTAAQIPGVSVFDDSGGAEMLRFGTATSGEVLLYSQSGKLLFHGGITAARGHSGDNYGRDAVIALVNNKSRPFSNTPVFGCSLLSKEHIL